MKQAFSFLSVFLLLGALQGASLFAKTESGGGVICYSDSEGYLIGAPPAWINLSGDAENMQVCGLFAPQDTNIQSAPALIYSRALEFSEGQDPLGAFIRSALETLKRQPGSEKSVISRHETFSGKNGLLFELYYLDWKPSGNTYEILACHAGEKSMLLVVLSAVSDEQRAQNVKDFKDVLYNIIPVTVSQNTD